MVIKSDKGNDEEGSSHSLLQGNIPPHARTDRQISYIPSYTTL
jgi:hypothetical protein